MKNSRQLRECHYTYSISLQWTITPYKRKISPIEKTNIDLYTDMKAARAAVSGFEKFHCCDYFPIGPRITHRTEEVFVHRACCELSTHCLFGRKDLVVLRLNVPVNNFSVMSGRSHRFLGN